MRTGTATVKTKVRTSVGRLWGTGRARELPDRLKSFSSEDQRAKRLDLVYRVHVNPPSLTLKQNRGHGSSKLPL